MNLKKRIKTARGKEKADIVLKGGTIVNTLTGTTEVADVAIVEDVIVGVGKYRGVTEIDCQGRYILPGLIDTHLHIESTMLSPFEFANTIIPFGTTTIICDPHEIANVLGLEGVRYIIEDLSDAPINAKVMLPSCVPATPFESAGAVIDGKMTAKALNSQDIFGLGEFMNFPGVINAEKDVIKKLESAINSGKIIDGHSMTLSGKDLNAYLVSGIKTDHECTNVEDMLEKIKRGVYIQLRQGSSTKNIPDLIGGITRENMRRCMFCTDDKHIDDLEEGHLNNNLRVAVECGLDPISAVTIATLNAAECYGLKGRGAIAPSYKADIIVCDNLKDFNVNEVFFEGRLVASEGKCLFEREGRTQNKRIANTMNTQETTPEMFKLYSKSDRVNTIKLIPKNVVTLKGEAMVKRDADGAVDLSGTGLTKLCVIERHNNTGNIGFALLENYNLKNGAIAQSIAHDSHNIIVMGDSDEDMSYAVNELIRIGGGLVVAKRGIIIAALRLEIAGLMTEKPKDLLKREFGKLIQAARKLDINKEVEPFMTMSFLALPVIPFVKITDKGLFDVEKFKFIPIEADLVSE